MLDALLPAIKLPKTFQLKAEPRPDGVIDVFFTTPKETVKVGEFAAEDLNGATLLKIFPDWKPGLFVTGALSLVKFPREFELSATPVGDHIDFKLVVQKVGGGEPWRRTKSVPVNKWDVSQLKELLGWIQQAKEVE